MAVNRKLFYRDEALERFYAEKSDYSESEDNFGSDGEGAPLGEISNEEDIVTKQSKLFDFENLDDHEEAVPPSPSVAMPSTNLRSALVDRYREDQSSHNNSNSSNHESTSESDDDTILALVRKRKQMKSKDKRDETRVKQGENVLEKNVTKKEMFKHQHQLQ